MTSFDDLGISAKLIDAMSEMGWTEPTPVQCEAVPLGIAGNDLIAKAQTGTGKTGAYSMIVMSRIGKGSKVPSALIITPTRELAMQVDGELRKLSKISGHVSAAVYGQVPYERQINMLRRGVDIVVGTPGRLKDLIERGALDLSEVSEVVLDEADRMLDIGFEAELNFIMEQVPELHQTLLFSATLSKQVMRLANNMLENPAEVDISGDDPTTGLTKQYIIPCKRNEKKTILYELLDKGTPKTIVFFATKVMVDEVYSEMKADGQKVGTLHGDMPQKLRERVINDFKDNHILTLLATDVASRGLDVTDVDMVINYDLPIDPETYLHRIGRTGRAGKEGVSISIVNPRDRKLVRMCEDEADTEMERIEPDDLEPIEAVHEPIYRERVKKEKKMKVEKHRNNDRRYSGEREGFTTLEINLGKADGLTRIEIADFLKQRAAVDEDGIGKVGLKDDRSFIEVSLDHSDFILENLNGAEFNGKTVTITQAPQKEKYQGDLKSDDGSFNRRRENRYKNYEKRLAKEAAEAEEELESEEDAEMESFDDETETDEMPERRHYGDRSERRGGFGRDRGYGDRRDRGFGHRDDRRGGYGRDRGDRRGFGDRPRRGYGDREYVRRDFREDSEDSGEFRERRDREDRPRRDFGHRDDRRGGFGRDRREGGYGDRPRRDRDFGDRPRRDRDFGDRPRRDFEDRPRREFNDSEDRPRFSDRGDRPRRDRDFGDRPRREGGFGHRDDRRGGFGRERGYGDRPKRDFGDRPRRDRDSEDRPRREGAGNGSKRINAKKYPSNRDKPRDKKRGKYCGVIMGLFRKKNQEPVPEPPRVVPINQDNWHEWAALAKGAMGEADMPKAVGYWVDAIARFDSPAAQYRKFHEDVMELVIAHMHKEIAEGKVIQAQMLCELDNKVAEVIPELQTTIFSDDLFYYIKENISAADGPATSARLYVCAAYAVLGYLRFSADMRVSVEKCQEASKLGIYAREQCLSYEKGKYAGALKPQPAAEFVEAFAVFYEEVQKALENALSSMSAEELEALADYRRSHVIDRIDSIGSAMQYCIHSTGRSARKKSKMGAECTAKIAQYIEASLDMNS